VAGQEALSRCWVGSRCDQPDHAKGRWISSIPQVRPVRTQLHFSCHVCAASVPVHNMCALCLSQYTICVRCVCSSPQYVCARAFICHVSVASGHNVQTVQLRFVWFHRKKNIFILVDRGEKNARLPSFECVCEGTGTISIPMLLFYTSGVLH
jgi:hypothetical protein